MKHLDKLSLCISRVILALLMCLICHQSSYALKGNINSHDPSGLQKGADGRYWQFTTGDGIYMAYSPDLITWTSGGTVFPRGTWPSWIANYVSNFRGNFWAPDVIYMDGYYYIYYSCSSFGSPNSAIGVARNKTLVQSSTDYKWEDLGMVVYSDDNLDINAIDPALFMDSDGRVFMSYGSFFGGIAVIEIDRATAKPKAGATLHKVAGGGHTDWEAPYIIKEGSYYYMYVNRGSCCNGVNSTYYIVYGRSSSPTGPFLDKSGIDLNKGGGTTVLAKTGKYIGPGHFGLLRENGNNFVSIHYYDGEDNGNAKLDILTMRNGSDGWPFLTRDWIPSGQYQVKNKNSGLVWQAANCSGANGEGIIQASANTSECQKWNFLPLGNGVYRITNQNGGRSVDIARCSITNGSKLQLTDWASSKCQQYKIERSSDGTDVYTPLSTARVVEVPSSSLSSGVQLAIYDYKGTNNQKWIVISTSSTTSLSTTTASTETTISSQHTNPALELAVYPNPIVAGEILSIFYVNETSSELINVDVFNIMGKRVFTTEAVENSKVNINLSYPGTYIVQIRKNDKVTQKRMIIVQ